MADYFTSLAMQVLGTFFLKMSKMALFPTREVKKEGSFLTLEKVEKLEIALYF